ncbi:MAG: protein kinase domain-containing protein [Gemmataceae bacterium]
MPQVSRCPHCQKSIQIPDKVIGKQVRCPGCKKPFTAEVKGREPAAAAVGSAAAGVAATSAAAATASAASTETTRPKSSDSIDLFESSSSAATSGTPSNCPACSAELLPGAVACMDCGYMLQTEADEAPAGTPSLCPNPACGVANSPTDRNCQRCGTPLPIASGTVLHDRYRIERQLAVGGFGAVYLATDIKSNDRPVAVKEMICPDPQEFAIRLNFFRRESEILRSLESVAIVPRVYDFIEEGQKAHLVLEFIKGQDLLKIMENDDNKPFPIERVIEWGKSICDVLSHMHGQNPPLVHRDLKPDNIMLLEDETTIKMIDFGTARDIGRMGSKERLAAKTRVFTEGYAPPEQIIGKPEPRSDLFALAGTLYHLVTGKSPEGFHTAVEIEEQLSAGNGAIPAEYRWFFELIKINLAEDCNDRYFTAEEFKADLEKKTVTKEKTCPKCKTVNKVREPYCTKCAEGLTDAKLICHHCGKINRMGSRCCIYCGNRLR